MSFDWNKLDSYKVALDDGFSNKRKGLEIEKKDKKYVALFYCGYGRLKCHVIEEDWEIFKKKVADYFLKS